MLPLFQIYVSQLSLLSHTSVIKSLLSADENAVVQKGESINFGLQTSSRNSTTSDDNAAVENSLHLTTVQTKSGKHFGVNEQPFVDFVKPAFTFFGRKKEPTLPRDVLIVVWRVAVGSSTLPPAVGFVFVYLKDDSNLPQVNDFESLDNATDGARWAAFANRCNNVFVPSTRRNFLSTASLDHRAFDL